MMTGDIAVCVSSDRNGYVMNSNVGTIQVLCSRESIPNNVFSDFAVWFFLPIAMRLGRSLYIDGTGTLDSEKNAKKLSEIWESWLPYHFSSIKVKFKEAREKNNTNGTLCFYSGGIDSTYSLLKRHKKGLGQDLITIHGMDYKVHDIKRFEELKEKTKPFSSMISGNHIFVTSDAYNLYRKHRVNPEGAHVSHIFSLAGNTFLFSENYNEINIAADYRLDQQFITYPWGSNSVTNKYFSDGTTRLVTLDDDVTRCEKLPLVITSVEALASVSFCTDYKSRPLNCGVCSKCMRTKVMFFSSTGQIPDIYKDRSISDNWYKLFDLKSNSQKAFLLDILTTAKSNNRSEELPNFETILSLTKHTPFKSTRLGSKAFKLLRKVRKIGSS